ncbi:MAG TPA: hypothetical protein VGH87_00700 [Polyangiaceae bacterium]|jgi:hypothetical protein
MSADVSKTAVIAELFATPRKERDDAWRAKFFDAIGTAAMTTTESQIMQGPDGFPYFVLAMPEPGKPFSPVCLADVLEHCTDSGVGMVVAPGEHGPEWVFTYGDLFSMRAYMTFEGDPADVEAARGPATEVLEKDTAVMVGTPNEEMLPPWARGVLASFLAQVGEVKEPSVLVMVRPSESSARNLVFNIHPEDFSSPDEFGRVLRRLQWFLPRGRSVIGLSRTSSLASSFAPLRGAPS